MDYRCQCQALPSKAGSPGRAGRRHAIGQEVDAEVREHWVGEVRMIQNIEEIGLELQFLVLAELKAARNREVEDTVTWAGEGVATRFPMCWVPGTQLPVVSTVQGTANADKLRYW